jgi:hypothetical protein
MKYIKIFEDFSTGTSLNEEAMKEVTLPGGFINRNTTDTNANQGSPDKPGVIYFDTNTTTPSKDTGSPGTLTVHSSDGSKGRKQLEFADNNFVDKDRIISYRYTDYAKIQSGGDMAEPTILAKNPAEAKAKAYEILGWGTFATPTPGDPKVLGNLLRSYFEIRKMYPEYMTKNSLLKEFLAGIIDGYPKGDFGKLAEIENFSVNIKNRKFMTEVGTVLREIGVITDPK